MRESGFTLIETILASTIAAIIGIALAVMLVNHTGFFYKENGLVNEGVGLNNTIKPIEDYVKQSSSVVSQYPEVGAPLYSSSSTVLVLKVPSINSMGVIGGSFDHVVVTQDASLSNVLRLIVYADPASLRKNSNQVITTYLDSVHFSYLDASGMNVTPASARQVQTDITIKSSVGTIYSQRTATSKTTLRNN